ncbi:MAG: nucleotidyl transferase AbiEii/AbiGii toxin family protein [Acidobacteriota bacterium]
MPWEVLERDYLLSWILAGIVQVEELRGTLVFKGGTALKKCYFGDEYRFSEDLDFSARETAPTGAAMEHTVHEGCHRAMALLEDFARVEIVAERYVERDPHPGGQEAFTIRARLPWHREPRTRVMIEITKDEEVLRPTPRLSEAPPRQVRGSPRHLLHARRFLPGRGSHTRRTDLEPMARTAGSPSSGLRGRDR